MSEILCCAILLIVIFDSTWFKQLISKIKNFKSLFGRFKISKTDYYKFISQLAISLKLLSNKKIGALIVLEKKENLNQYISLGFPVKAKFNHDFLINIFGNKKSSFHDGGVIIRDYNIVSVSSYFPITYNKMTVSYGARHRAAAGISENTDAIAFVVSETNGNISIFQRGKMEEFNYIETKDLTESIDKILKN